MIELDIAAGAGPRRVIIAAFDGWNDAADAATSAVTHLAGAWDTRPLGQLEPDDYYDFQVNRPTVAVGTGTARRIDWPATVLVECRPPGRTRDVVLIRGPEPNLRWRAYCAELVEATRRLNTDLVILLGALLADAPHTRPVPVSGTAGDAETATLLRLDQSRYEGPTGIVGVLAEACADAGLPTVSLWAAVPHYAAQPPCPKATLALLRRVEDLLDVELPLGDLPEQARAWERMVDELAESDSEVEEYVRSLESREPETELPEASGDVIAMEFERYLRRNGGT